MYSLLQSLALVPPNSIPSVQLLIPFGEESLLQMPSLPTDFSIVSIGGFIVRLLASPGVLTFLHAFYLRPNLEERLYRLIRRQLPKPMLADELSIRVAYDENLVDWVVPTLGRRSEEETRRAKLPLLEDIKCELSVFRDWVFSLFGIFSNPASEQQVPDTLNQERIQNLRNSIESLQHELEEVQLRNNLVGETSDAALSRLSGALARTSAVDMTRLDLPTIAEDDQVTEELDLGINQLLTSENRISQSPGEMSNDYFSEMATLGRTSAPSQNSISQSSPSNAQPGDSPSSTTRDQHSSRANTLFSRPSSPDTSPPTSPRVRASLIHQTSDIITMQLELLGNRNRNTQNQTPTGNSSLPRMGRGTTGLRPPSTAMDRRSIADFLEALILSQAQQQASQSPLSTEHDGLSNTNTQTSSTTPEEMPALEPIPRNPAQQSTNSNQPPPDLIEGISHSNIPNILPDGVQEPAEEEQDGQPSSLVGTTRNAGTRTTPGDQLPPIGSRLAGTHSLSGAHRVTLLSAHPVDSLASHLAAFISTIILSPIESFCLRSLAHSYLSLHPSALIGASDLHPVGLWFGGNSWSDILAYSGRMILMRGMQAALRAGVWGFLVGSTMRIGRKFCGWGTL